MIKMTNHQTIAITVTGLAELAHSEYQVRLLKWQCHKILLVIVSHELKHIDHCISL